MSKKYETIIFDLDGTLLDTSAGIFNSVRFAEKQMGFAPVPDEALRRFVGPPPKKMYRQMYGVDEETALKATMYHRQYSREKAIYEACIYVGVQETLEELKRRGYKLAVATLKGQKIAEIILDRFGLAGRFDAIVGMDEAESLTKCKAIQCAIEGTQTVGAALMVGDSDNDALGAEEAGVDFVGVTYGFGISEKETRFPLVFKPKELLSLVEE